MNQKYSGSVLCYYVYDSASLKLLFLFENVKAGTILYMFGFFSLMIFSGRTCSGLTISKKSDYRTIDSMIQWVERGLRKQVMVAGKGAWSI